jgi:adenosylcobyric acid synthase
VAEEDHGDGSRCSRDLQAFKEEQYNKLAAHVRKYVDIDRIYKILTNG